MDEHELLKRYNAAADRMKAGPEQNQVRAQLEALGKAAVYRMKAGLPEQSQVRAQLDALEKRLREAALQESSENSRRLPSKQMLMFKLIYLIAFAFFLIGVIVGYYIARFVGP